MAASGHVPSVLFNSRRPGLRSQARSAMPSPECHRGPDVRSLSGPSCGPASEYVRRRQLHDGTANEKMKPIPSALFHSSGRVPRSLPVQIENQLVDVSCGQCQFGMEGDGCDLAIRHDGKSYFVSGSGIDDHGDAHADDGMCNCVRQAKVSGTIQDGTFHVRSIEFIDDAANSE